MPKYFLMFPLLLAATPALAGQPATTPPPAQLQRVIDCRGVADSAQRLACYDAGVAAMEQAASNREIVVVDREQVHKARQSLFGFATPALDLFGGSSSDKSKKTTSPMADDDIQEVTGTVQSAQQDRDGYWIVLIKDGAVWHQTGGMIALRPRPGDPITIKRGAIGSYVMRIGKQPGVKARRDS